MQVENSDTRIESRSNVLLMATLAGESVSCPVRIRNLSRHGALLEGGSLPAEGARSDLRRGSLRIKGQIAWRHERFCGMHFEGDIEVDEWVKRAGPEAQQRIDAAIAQFRRDPRLTSSSDGPSVQTPDIESIASNLLQICERIAALPDMSTELAVELMKIEAAAHSLRSSEDLRR